MTSTEHPSPHLEPKTPPVDLACPGLMVAANASLVLGYLWIDWVSKHGEQRCRRYAASSSLRSSQWRSSPCALCTRRQLPGSVVVLPAAVTVVLIASVAAVATGYHALALSAGATALVLGIAAVIGDAARGECSILDQEQAASLHAWRGCHPVARSSQLDSVRHTEPAAIVSRTSMTPE